MNEKPYTLTVKIQPDQLETIYKAKANIVIGKKSVDTQPNVAWQVFQPMQTNSLTWVNQYGVYASTCDLVADSEIVQRSYTGIHAVKKRIYTLQSDGCISHPEAGGSDDYFTVNNEYNAKKIMTVGLYQNANVNGDDVIGNAISATPVMLGHTANLIPDTTVCIWLQRDIKSNTVINDVCSEITILYFNPKLHEITVFYNDESGRFICE